MTAQLAAEHSTSMVASSSNGSFQERRQVLANWLRHIQDSEFWRPYCREATVQQCNHPDRANRIEMMVSKGDLVVSAGDLGSTIS